MQKFTYEELLTSFRKGLRNGNWRKLGRLEKALHSASLLYLQVQGEVINKMLVSKLSVLVDKLKATSAVRVFRSGFEKATVWKVVSSAVGSFIIHITEPKIVKGHCEPVRVTIANIATIAAMMFAVTTYLSAGGSSWKIGLIDYGLLASVEQDRERG